MQKAVNLSARVLASIADAPQPAWDRLFGNAALGFDYYRACELATPEAFRFLAAGAFEDDVLVAGVPLFEVTFRVDMPLEGFAKSAVQTVGRVWPRLTNIPILGAGSPHAEQLALVFPPSADVATRARCFEALLAEMERHAAASEVDLVVLKDMRDADARWCHEVLASRGFARTAALPVAMLDLPFASEEAYLASLSQNMRSNLRRKLKKASRVRVEVRDRIDDLRAEITALFEETRVQAQVDYDVFEQLSPSYFATVLDSMKENARVILYWLDEELIAFSLVLIEKGILVFQYIGMRYPAAREHNIYFLNWMQLVRMCLARGIARLHAGQSTYLTKVRLGSKLERNWIYFRHRTPMWNRVFHFAAPRAGFDKMDPDLAELGAEAPYLD